MGISIASVKEILSAMKLIKGVATREAMPCARLVAAQADEEYSGYSSHVKTVRAVKLDPERRPDKNIVAIQTFGSSMKKETPFSTVQAIA